MSLVEWTAKTRLYFDQNSEGYGYLGTQQKPLSTAIKIEEDTLHVAMRFPPVTEKILRKRHINKKLKLVGSTINFDVKFALMVLFRMKTPYRLIKRLPTKEFDKKTIYLYAEERYSEFKKKIAIVSDLHQYFLPVTQDILAWINDKSNVEPNKEISLFMKILSKADQYSRQLQLSKLVQINSPTGLCLIHLLSRMNEEYFCAVYRELARQGINSVQLIDYAKLQYLILPEGMAAKKYTFYYLLSFEEPELMESTKMRNFYLQRSLFRSLNIVERFNMVSDAISTETKTSSALLPYYHLATFDTTALIEQAKHHYTEKSTQINAILFRRAIMGLIKFAETQRNGSLLGISASLSIIGRSIHQEKGILHFNEGPSNFVMKYVQRRIVRQLQLWEEIGLEDEVEKALITLLSSFPPEKQNILELTVDGSNSWIQNTPFIKQFNEQIIKIIQKDIDVFKSVIRNFISQGHLLAFHWLIENLPNKLMKQLPSIIDHQSAFQLYLSANTSGKIDSVLQKSITQLKKSDVQFNWDLEINVEDFEPVLTFFTKINKQIPSDIFSSIVEGIIMQDFNGRSLLEIHLKSFGKGKTSLITSYHKSIIAKLFELSKLIDLTSEHVESFIVDLLLKIEDLTKVDLPIEEDYKQDALKIIFDNKITSNKLDAWSIISVESIVYCYKLTGGNIPIFLESTVSYAITKPNFDQLARHYLALGIERPSNQALKKSRLKEIPQMITKDVLGQISIISETIKYCTRNGFNTTFENLIIKNIYKRGWNIDRDLDSKLFPLFGILSQRLRSYFAAYMVLEKSEVAEEILSIARDVENHQLRESMLRSFERFGTADIWIILCQSIYDDVALESINQLKETRMSKSERETIVVKLINMERKQNQQLGLEWMAKYDLLEIVSAKILFLQDYESLTVLFDLLTLQVPMLNATQKDSLLILCLSLLWKPNIPKKLREYVITILIMLYETGGKRDTIMRNFEDLADTAMPVRENEAIRVLSRLNWGDI